MWLALAFLSALLLGFYDVFKKCSLSGNALMPVLFLNTLFCSLVFLPLVAGSASGWIANDAEWFIPLPDARHHIYIASKAVLVLSSWLLGYIGIKHLPLTIVGPINASRPVLVLLGALFIYGERLNLYQWTGVTLAIIAFFMLSRTGRREGIRFAHNRWIACIVGAAILGGASGLYDKFLLAPADCGGVGLHRMVVQSWYNFYQCALMLIMLLTFRYIERGHNGASFHWSWCIPCISLFLCAADFVYFEALTYPDAMISVVSMVRRGSVVVSFLFGALMLHEKNLRSKALDLLLVLLSLIFLWLGS